MGLERQLTGRFDAHCDGCGKTLNLYSYHPGHSQRLLRNYGWKRVDYPCTAHRPAYEWNCTTCAPKELAL